MAFPVLSGTDERRRHYTRHNEIRDTLQHVAMMAGAQTRREVEGLSEDSKIRPTCKFCFQHGGCLQTLWWHIR